MKKTYNKLVRDNLLQVYEEDLAAGKISAYKVRTLSAAELKTELAAKLKEEALEVVEALQQGDKSKIVEELADVCEVLEALMTEVGIAKEEIATVKQQKLDKRGGFSQGVFLESIDFADEV